MLYAIINPPVTTYTIVDPRDPLLLVPDMLALNMGEFIPFPRVSSSRSASRLSSPTSRPRSFACGHRRCRTQQPRLRAWPSPRPASWVRRLVVGRVDPGQCPSSTSALCLLGWLATILSSNRRATTVVKTYGARPKQGRRKGRWRQQ